MPIRGPGHGAGSQCLARSDAPPRRLAAYYHRSVSRSAHTAIEGNDIPQANSLDRIRSVVAAVKAGAESPSAIRQQTKLSQRHVAYHVQAARILGWFLDLPDGPEVTVRGDEMLETEPRSDEEQTVFTNSIVASPSVSAVAPNLLAAIPPSLEEITANIVRQTSLSESTAERRARTLLAWRDRVRETTLLSLFGTAHSKPKQSRMKAKAKTKAKKNDALKSRAAPPKRRNVLKSIRYQDWKSFRDATLFVDPLTVVIGTNAGGKSNALDGLEFLHRVASGEELSVALAGGPQVNPIRGGAEWAARHGTSRFTLEVVVQGLEERTDYVYSISVQTKPRLQLHAEKLTRVKYRLRTPENPTELQLFWTDTPGDDEASITARFYNRRAGTRRAMRRNVSILAQTSTGPSGFGVEISAAITEVIECLRNLFVLDPVTSQMRDYSPFSEVLAPDASNVAGVLAALNRERKHVVEETLTRYLRRLPERDIKKVTAEPVGKFKRDAMLYCYEQWSNKPATPVDARGMSDGTLRFVAILTALLTRPAGSLLVVEEVDTGLHASRAALLLEMLRVVGRQNGIDVLVTTHNQALIDALGAEMVPFVVVAHRKTDEGFTELTLLEDLEMLPKLLASGPLGNAVARGLIEKSLDSER